MVFFSRYLPITSFVISMSALVFQTTVLFPWHHKLDADFKNLKAVKQHQDEKMEEYNAKKMIKIVELEKKLSYLEVLQEKKQKLIAEKKARLDRAKNTRVKEEGQQNTELQSKQPSLHEQNASIRTTQLSNIKQELASTKFNQQPLQIKPSQQEELLRQWKQSHDQRKQAHKQQAQLNQWKQFHEQRQKLGQERQFQQWKQFDQLRVVQREEAQVEQWKQFHNQRQRPNQEQPSKDQKQSHDQTQPEHKTSAEPQTTEAGN